MWGSQGGSGRGPAKIFNTDLKVDLFEVIVPALVPLCRPASGFYLHQFFRLAQISILPRQSFCGYPKGTVALWFLNIFFCIGVNSKRMSIFSTKKGLLWFFWNIFCIGGNLKENTDFQSRTMGLHGFAIILNSELLRVTILKKTLIFEGSTWVCFSFFCRVGAIWTNMAILEERQLVCYDFFEMFLCGGDLRKYRFPYWENDLFLKGATCKNIDLHSRTICLLCFEGCDLKDNLNFHERKCVCLSLSGFFQTILLLACETIINWRVGS